MKKLLYIILGSALFTACDRDFFASQVEVELPEHESKIVMVGNLSKEGSYAHLSRSVGPGQIAPRGINGIDFKLFENGVFVRWIEARYEGMINGDSAWTYPILTTPKIGAFYRAELNHPEYGMAIAEALAHDTAVLGPLELVRTYADEFGESYYDVKFRISDVPGDQGYILEARVENGSEDPYDTYFYSNDLSTNEFYESGGDTYNFYGYKMFITDKTFRSSSKDITLTVPSFGSLDINDVIISVTSVSPEALEFINLAELQYYNYEDPFAEPILLEGNVSNGFGLFYITTTASTRID